MDPDALWELCWKWAGCYQPTPMFDRGDYAMEMWIDCWRNIPYWDPSRKTKLTTYLHRFARGAVLHAFRRLSGVTAWEYEHGGRVHLLHYGLWGEEALETVKKWSKQLESWDLQEPC